MGNATYQSDPAAWQALALSDDVAAAVKAVAEVGKGMAEAMASDFDVTGDYQSSFDVRSTTAQITTKAGVHEAVVAILENTSPHALAVEFGNQHDSAAHHVLGRVRDVLTNQPAPGDKSRKASKPKYLRPTKRSRAMTSDGLGGQD